MKSRDLLGLVYNTKHKFNERGFVVIYYKRLSLLVFAFLSIFLISSPSVIAASGYTWHDAASSLGTQHWSDIAMSASGKYQTATVYTGDIYNSHDYGVTWTNVTNGLRPRRWISVTSSWSGKYMAVVNANAGIFISNDYGVTWVNKTDSLPIGDLSWFSISSSKSGQYLAAAAFGSGIFTSNDYGVTWVNSTSSPLTSKLWDGVAISSTGQYIIATAAGNDVYTSSDFGLTWLDATSGLGHKGWFGSSISADGKYLEAVVNGGDIYTSSDYGTTWVDSSSSLGSKSWIGISSSASGQYLAASAQNSDIYTSSDFGANWDDSSGPGSRVWSDITITPSGQYVASEVGGGPGGGDVGDVYLGNNPALRPVDPGITNHTSIVPINGSIVVDVLGGVDGVDVSSLKILSGPSHGTAVDPPGTITYTPSHGFVGSDSLIYQVCSLLDDTVCSSASLNFNIVPGLPNTGVGIDNSTPQHFLPVPQLIAFGSAFSFGSGWLLITRQMRRNKVHK